MDSLPSPMYKWPHQMVHCCLWMHNALYWQQSSSMPQKHIHCHNNGLMVKGRISVIFYHINNGQTLWSHNWWCQKLGVPRITCQHDNWLCFGTSITYPLAMWGTTEIKWSCFDLVLLERIVQISFLSSFNFLSLGCLVAWPNFMT